MPPRKRLGQLLTELGVIDEHQLQSALGHQKQWGGKLGGILVQKGFCSEETVVSALAKHLGMQSVRLADVKIDPRAVKCVSKQVAEKLHVFPYELSGSGRSEVVTIAMSDPTDLSAVDQLAFHTGKRIKPMLAGDGDVVAAIQAHYGGGEEKKEPTDKVARPAPAGLPTVTPGAPSGSVAGFPRRIEPPASAPGAARARAAPYIPPPIPAAKPAAPAQKLDEIEPDASTARPAPAPAVADPVELPEDDGQEFGLEPIAAHSQFGDAVVGQEDVAGEGFAGDMVEGLVSASVAHAAVGAAHPDPRGAPAQEAEDWQAQSGAAQGWDTPPSNSPAASAAAEWGQPADPQGSTGWTAPIEMAASGGWADPAANAGPPRAATNWGVPESDAEIAWGVPQAEQVAESTSIALPTDAILGAVEEIGADPEAQAIPVWAEDVAAPEQEAPAGQATEQTAFAADPTEPHEAEAPDAWAATDDPLAAGAAPTDPFAAGTGPGDPLEAAAGTPDREEPPAVHRSHSSTQEFANPVGADDESAEIHVESAAAEEQPAGEWQGDEQVPMEGNVSTDSVEQLVERALEGSTPLSPADLGALASIGVEPSDGVGALRLLAALVRLLNRNQLIEPDDLRAEIRESLAQGAAAALFQDSNGMESEASSPDASGPSIETAET
ncbi:MAG: hypothetical protein AUG04_05320 [Deltaproteobacteria bacterium 13_1_20CM_2_69_21]|nr:MAG: hypothetical protein AUG04_05320 [Deltaproteobacteria bacterium 13_1_20CM_2_69_21]